MELKESNVVPVRHYTYEANVHQVTKDMETFWSEVLGCTMCIIRDENGISITLLDGMTVAYTTFGRNR
jgi:hypothetical protein